MEDPTTAQPRSLRKKVAGNSLAKTFSFVLLLAIIGLIGLLSYKVMRSFLLPLFLAALVVVIFRPVHAWIAEKCGNRESLAAGLTTAAILLLALGPIAWMVAAGVQEGLELTDQGKVRELTTELKEKRKEWGWEPPFGGRLDEIGGDLAALKLEQPQSPDFANEMLYIHEFGEELRSFRAVSYTHLTLPTICSV